MAKMTLADAEKGQLIREVGEDDVWYVTSVPEGS